MNSLSNKFAFSDLKGQNPSFLENLELANRVAQKNVNIFIQGESGTGKTMLARSIHFSSQRKDQPFVKVDPTAFSSDLFLDSLVGHERGAFTGAKDYRKGKFEQVHKGTLFIDNINLMSIPVQISLLSVLEEGVFEKMGSDRLQETDFRLICASNQDLMNLVDTKKFRSDLYYRIRVVQIDLPPLRSRKEDILKLAKHFIRHFCKKQDSKTKQLSSTTQDILLKYSWPGNVRELKGVCEAAVALSPSSTILPEDLQLDVSNFRSDSMIVEKDIQNQVKHLILKKGLTLDMIEREAIKVVLEEFNGNQSRASQHIGISRMTLSRKIKKMGLVYS